MPTVAVFSPSLDGHRQTYCGVLAQILLGDGLDVTVVAGIDPASRSRVADAAPQLRELERFERYRFVGLPESGMPMLQQSPSGFMRLLDEIAADAVFLTEADACLTLLNARMVCRGRPRRWVGLFIRSTNYLHEHRPEPGLNVVAAIRRVRRVRRRLRRWRTDPWLFHEVLLPRLGLTDAALYLDEGFVAAHGDSALWLPDIFAPRPWRGEHESAETRDWAARLGAFMEDQAGRPAYVYLGAPQLRRGYDTLLQLAVAEDGCLIHCGRHVDDAAHWPGVESARRELLRRGALLEMDAYYESDSTADLFLGRASTVVLPYRSHHGSSGVMLQALAAGRPVLVPDEGLMAERVRAFGLGRTYRAGDWDDLRRQDRLLRDEGPRLFQANIEAFMSYFSREQTEDAVRRAMGYGSQEARMPVPGVVAVPRGEHA